MNIFRRIYNFVTGSPYDGANYSTKRGYRQNAKVQSGRFDGLKATRLELIRKSRDFEKNSGMFNRLCDLFELYTVGQGLQVQPSSSDPAWNEKARNYWRDTERLIDLTSRQPMSVLESLWAREWFVDGECFVVLTSGEPDADGRRRPRIKCYRAHQIGTPPSLSGRENIDVFDGIRLDARDRIISYYFDQGNGNFEEVEARYVVPIVEPSTLDGLHGFPFVTPVVNEFQDLIELDSLEMEKAKWAAQRTDVISTRTGEMSEQSAKLRRFGVTGVDDGTTAGSKAESERIAAVKSVTGVAPVLLRETERMEQFVNNNPSAVTQQYYRTREEKACGGIGIPRILVYPESMQGTVYRGALDMANAFFKARHLVLAEAKRRIYEFVMGWAIHNEPALFGAPKDWYRVTIPQPRAVNVDVGRNSAAAIAEMQAGLMPLESWYGPLGQDWRDGLVKIKEQQEFAKSIGLILPGTPQVAGPGEQSAGQAQAEPLNGAQITAAIDVLVKLREEVLTPQAVIELLTGIGIEREKAISIVNGAPIGMDSGAGDAAFKREVLKQLLSVPAAREAVYNGVDIEDLITQTGLTPENGYEAPFIPVIAPSGPLVSGDTVKDPQGDIVGGDIEEQKQPQQPKPTE